jgi:hypothetical protein
LLRREQRVLSFHSSQCSWSSRDYRSSWCDQLALAGSQQGGEVNAENVDLCEPFVEAARLRNRVLLPPDPTNARVMKPSFCNDTRRICVAATPGRPRCKEHHWRGKQGLCQRTCSSYIKDLREVCMPGTVGRQLQWAAAGVALIGSTHARAECMGANAKAASARCP